MYKQSFFIIFIQLIGIILGFLSIYLVAGDMGPDVYSLVGVYTVVSGVVLTFSHLGVESTMMRETLFWKEKGDYEKIKEYTMQSILSRMIGFFVLTPFIIAYLCFMSITKYNGGYWVLLISFFIGSCASALNDSMSLIIRSQGGFVFSQFAKTLNNTITKFIAIFVYLEFGSLPYLYFYALFPLPLMVIFVFKLRGCIDFGYLSFKGTVTKIKESKNLWLKSYLDYFSASADSLLVTIIFPASVIGVYTLYKNLEVIAKGFIEGFFDVLTQKLVQFKGNVLKLLTMENKLNKVRWVVISLIIIISIVFLFNSSFFIHLINLQKYERADLVILCVLAVSALYLVGKNEINIISLFAPSKIVLDFGFLVFIVTLLSFGLVIGWPSIYGVLFQRVIIFLVTSIAAIHLLNKNRLLFYSGIYK